MAPPTKKKRKRRKRKRVPHPPVIPLPRADGSTRRDLHRGQIRYSVPTSLFPCHSSCPSGQPLSRCSVFVSRPVMRTTYKMQSERIYKQTRCNEAFFFGIHPVKWEKKRKEKKTAILVTYYVSIGWIYIRPEAKVCLPCVPSLCFDLCGCKLRHSSHSYLTEGSLGGSLVLCYKRHACVTFTVRFVALLWLVWYKPHPGHSQILTVFLGSRPSMEQA